MSIYQELKKKAEEVSQEMYEEIEKTSDELEKEYDKAEAEFIKKLKAPFRGITVEVTCDPEERLVLINLQHGGLIFTYEPQHGRIEWRGITEEQANKFIELCKEYVG